MKLTKLNYVSEAEKTIRNMIEKNKKGEEIIKLTTSKIRNLLSMISEIYNDVTHLQSEKLDEDMQSRIQYLKMRFAYEAGREDSVKKLIEKGSIFKIIDDIGDDKQQLIIFCKYMEAIVAYRKFLVKGDQ